MALRQRLAENFGPSDEISRTRARSSVLRPADEVDGAFGSRASSPALALREQLAAGLMEQPFAPPAAQDRRSPRQALLFIVGSSALLWGLIAWGVHALIR